MGKKIITIVKGIGSGRTKLAAFDAALYDAGISNLNLIYLSSIIPESFLLRTNKINKIKYKHGSKIFLVSSHYILEQKGAERYIGLGWIYQKGRGGIIAEFNSNNRKETINYIEDTLRDMNKTRKIMTKPVIKMLRIICKNRPICGIIAAVYKAEEW